MSGEVKDLETEVRVLKRQVLGLRRALHNIEEWRDVVSSPLWKRAWFWICGWNFCSLGRWYRKSLWNEDGRALSPPEDPCQSTTTKTP